MSALGAALRRALADAAPLVTVLALVTVTAALAALAPRLHTRTSDEALSRIVSAAPPAARELTLRSTNDYRLHQFDLIDQQVRSSLSGPLRELVEEPTFALVTPRYDSYAWPTGEPFHPRPYAWLKIRHQSGLLDQVRWVRGREPRASGTATLDGTPGGDAVPRLEVALDEGVADELGMAVGDRVLLQPLEGQLGRGGPVLVEITGLYTPRDPDDVAWDYDPLLRSPGLEVTGSGELLARYASALVAEPTAVRAAAATLDFEWHYPVRTSGVDADNAAEVLRGLEQFSVQGFSVVRSERRYLGAVPGYVAHSGLHDLVQGYLRQAGSAESVVAMVLAGVLLVALLVVGVATRLLGRRRAAVVRLARARGASWAQLLGLQVLEALCLAVPAGLVGHRLALLAVDSRPSPLSLVLVVALVVVTVGWATLSAWQEARNADDPDRAGTSASRWRWREVAEGLLVLAAVGGVLLVRRRSVGGVADTGADPLVALVPLLVALAAGVVVLRGYQAANGPLLRAVGRRRGAVGLLALAAAGRRSGVTAAAVVVLLAGTAFSLFASSVTTTIRDGQAEAAYLAVGADYRLDGPAFSEEQAGELAAVEGLEEVAPAFLRSDVPVAGSDDTVQEVAFVAVDSETYPSIAAAAAPGEEPARLDDLAGEPAGDAVLRVLVTPGVLDAGDDLSLALGSGVGDVPVEVVGTLDRFPLTDGAETVVADFDALRESEDGVLRATTLLARGGAGSEDEVQQLASAWDVTAVARHELLASTRGLPFVDSTVAVFRLGFAAVAAYVVAAVVMYLLLTADTRARLLGTLRRLGMARRQARAVAGLELAPVVTLALLAGTVTGLGLSHLLVPAVELTPFTGGASPPGTVVSLGFAAALVAAVGVVVVVATLGVTALAGRRHPADPERTGADE